MQIRISTRHGHLAAKTQEKIIERINKRVRGFHQLCGVSVTIDLKSPRRPHLSATLTSKNARDFATSDTSNNLWSSLDRIAGRLHRHLQRKKERFVERHRPPHISGHGFHNKDDVDDQWNSENIPSEETTLSMDGI